MVRRLARKGGTSASLGMVVIDYLQLVSTSDLNEEKREREVAVITGEMKKLCRELNCAVWSPSQLNERGQLRSPSAIGHAADVILTVVEGQGIRVDKNRNGSRDFIMPLILDGRRRRSANAASHAVARDGLRSEAQASSATTLQRKWLPKPQVQASRFDARAAPFTRIGRTRAQKPGPTRGPGTEPKVSQ